MNRKILLITVLALLILSALNMNMRGASAAPQSPYIAIDIESNTMFAGYNRTISIKTDYAGNDVWGWDVKLTFDKNLLQCVKVDNGDLITATKDPSAEFHSTINNTIGEVKAGALFYYDEITFPPFVTSGPGTLVKITFKGLSYGSSDLHLEKETKLQVYNPAIDPDEPAVKIGADTHPYQIGHGTSFVTIPGDVNTDRGVDVLDRSGMSAHWSGPPTGPLGFDRNFDVNDDGRVDILERSIASAHWGQHW